MNAPSPHWKGLRALIGENQSEVPGLGWGFFVTAKHRNVQGPGHTTLAKKTKTRVGLRPKGSRGGVFLQSHQTCWLMSESAPNTRPPSTECRLLLNIWNHRRPRTCCMRAAYGPAHHPRRRRLCSNSCCSVEPTAPHPAVPTAVRFLHASSLGLEARFLPLKGRPNAPAAVVPQKSQLPLWELVL